MSPLSTVPPVFRRGSRSWKESRVSRHTASRLTFALWVAFGAVSACRPSAWPQPVPVPPPAVAPPAFAIIPVPALLRMNAGEQFTVDSTVTVVIDASAPADVEAVAKALVTMLSPAVASAVRRLAPGDTAPSRAIHLTLSSRILPIGSAFAGITVRSAQAAESYTLDVVRDRIRISASSPAGLYYSVQTLRQLLPVSVEHPAALRRLLTVPAVHVEDMPRFEWRGAMLDVARHFLEPADVRRFIDAMALYKLNRLHLHLADDQGWRIEIRSWPNLARHGGGSEVGGGPGGFYTQADFAALVAYARERFIMIVPEIDMPGHTNAALSSYAALNCDGIAPPRYTGTRVGFSALCVTQDSVYRFVDDVVRELAEISPGPYMHIGGDEVERLTPVQYRSFVERVQGIVRANGRRMIGWGEIAPAALDTTTVVQHWRADSSHLHAARGGRVLLSPAKRMYLDMKYDTTVALGLRWAGVIELRDAYSWDPSGYLPGVPDSLLIGVEAPLWSESLEKLEDFEFMAFPRLLAIAEIGWSPASARAWDTFRPRIAVHGPRLSALGVNFYRSPQVDWLR